MEAPLGDMKRLCCAPSRRLDTPKARGSADRQRSWIRERSVKITSAARRERKLDRAPGCGGAAPAAVGGKNVGAGRAEPVQVNRRGCSTQAGGAAGFKRVLAASADSREAAPTPAPPRTPRTPPTAHDCQTTPQAAKRTSGTPPTRRGWHYASPACAWYR